MSTGQVPYLPEIDARFNVLEAIAIGGALASAKIIVGNGGGVAAPVSMSGDATISNAGAVTVSKVANKAVSHVPMFGGLSAAEVDADATVTIAAAGVLATDVVVATLSAAANAVYVTKAVCTANTITVTLSGNGGAGTVVNYVVFRAA
jgi:hypothetical protein